MHLVVVCVQVKLQHLPMQEFPALAWVPLSEQLHIIVSEAAY